MPHLIIESSSSIPASFVETLHQLVGEQETVSIEAVKTRLYAPQISFSGAAMSPNHIAITLKLLAGRSPELKEQMAANIFAKAQALMPNASLSVEILDLGTYKK